MTTKWVIRTLVCGAAVLQLGCTSVDPSESTGEVSERLTFVSSGGLVSMEAEHFTTNTAAGVHSWASISASTASGGTALQATPNNGTVINTGYTSSSPRLNFDVNFAAAGTYYVWVRGRDSEATAGNSDSVHVGLDGQALASADRIGSFPTTLTWTKATMDGADATIQVPSAGQHTVNVWMREDGFIFDKLVLSSSSGYTPSGNGPAETVPPTPTCSDGVQNGTETGIDCGGTCPACPSGTNAVWLEAEAGVRSGSPGFALQSSSAASGGQYLSAPSGSSPNAPGSARATYNFTVPAGTYKVWGRVTAPTADDDSVWLSMDSGPFTKWNSMPLASSWAWDDLHDSDNNSVVVTYSLSAGAHTLVVANREDGLLLDKLYVTAKGDVPSGLGGGNASCSDGVQNQGETGVDCGGPCAACQSCGDGTCNANETCASCAADCGPCSTCGNSVCDASESCTTCAQDCGQCSSWISQDIGAVGATGTTSVTAGPVIALAGSGDDIHSTYAPQLDEFRFAYQAIPGDVSLTARVASVTNTNEWAKGGVMIRESLSADSKYAFVFARPDRGVQAQFRAQTGQTGTDTGNPQGGTAAIKWLRVQRAGNQLSTYYSTDGTTFTQVGSTTTISMAATAYVGFAVTSHNDGVLCTASFDNVVLSGTPPPACGNGTCTAPETCSTCPADCGACNTCGNGTCGSGETCSTCPADCGACNTCGNGTCGSGETCSTCPADCGACPPQGGLDSRPPNPTCLVVEPKAATAKVAEVWPSNITFNYPIQAVQPPGESTRLIVVERAGLARSAPFSATSSAQVTTFLQLSNVVTASNGGFLSMAFHPQWQTNRYAYVLYTTNNLMKRVSRFQSTDGGVTLNPSTEQVVLQIQHLKEFNHNGGQIAFGLDGYLYISSGDDAYLDYNRAVHAADTTSWFGKVFRIDVDNGSPYAIPPSNPFASGGGRPEVYAYGLRNPWRFSFDRMTGDLWLADVGEETWEEVNLIQSGQFYGWPYYEGDGCGPKNCNGTPYVFPHYEYTAGAASISGGFVYRGAAIPSLQGKYVFGDYVSGTVTTYDQFTGVDQDIPGSSTGAVVGFGEDNAGEIYVVRFSSTGRVQKLVPDTSGGPSDYPTLLTDTGCFGPTDATQARSGVIPFDVAQEFWNDGATSQRYFAIPDGTTISVAAEGDFQLPAGGVSMQTLSYQGQRIETRFLVRHPSGTYGAYTYEWNAAQTQATLVPAGGKTRSLPGLEWSYLPRSQCFTCHSGAAGTSLGLETRQLNTNAFYPSTGRTANQLLTLTTVNLLSGNTASIPPFPELSDSTASLQDRSLAYLHVSCSGCHQPGGGGPGPMDLRYTTPYASKNLCGVLSTFNDMGVPEPAYLLNPGDHMTSVFWLRLTSRGVPGAMPPVGTKLPDAAAATVVQQWIDGLSGCP